MIKLISNVVNEKQLRDAQLRALELFANVVKSTYGPMGGYTTYSEYMAGNHHDVVGYYTKDGFTVLKHIQCDKPIECMIKDDIRTICTQVIKTIGDGTTSATILSYYIFKGLLSLQRGKKYPKRKVIKYFKEHIKSAIEIIESRKRECTLDDIYNIAYTSLDGNEEMAKVIQNIYKESGMNVFIDVSPSNNKDTIVKTYGGMVYEAGYLNPCFINNIKDNVCDLPNTHVYVFESPIDTPAMSSILRLIFDTEVTQPLKNKLPVTPTVVICPTISRDENSFLDNLETYFNNISDIEVRPKFCIVTNLSNDNNYLMDIKSMTGATFIKKYIDKEAYKKDQEEGLAPTIENITTFAGTAEEVIVDALNTKIINPRNMYNEDGTHTDFFNNYVSSIKDLLAKYEETREEIVTIGKLKKRLHLLEANMVDLYVGGIGTSDRMVLSDAIEDAVLNCRSASEEGVCYAANYEGFKAFSNIHRDCAKESEEFRAKLVSENQKEKGNTELDPEQSEQLYELTVKTDTAEILCNAYLELVKQIYLPFVDDDEIKATMIAIQMVGQYYKPLNIMTEEFDDKVLTSAKTEPAILDSISRIITTLFNTNQFLVPDPRFNIYAMSEEDDKEEKKIESGEKKPDIDLTKKIDEEVILDESGDEYLGYTSQFTEQDNVQDAEFSEIKN